MTLSSSKGTAPAALTAADARLFICRTGPRLRRGVESVSRPGARGGLRLPRSCFVARQVPHDLSGNLTYRCQSVPRPPLSVVAPHAQTYLRSGLCWSVKRFDIASKALRGFDAYLASPDFTARLDFLEQEIAELRSNLRQGIRDE